MKYLFVIIFSFHLVFPFSCNPEPQCIMYGKVIDVQFESKHFCCDKYQVWIIQYSDGSRVGIIRYEDYYQELHTENIGKSVTKLVDCKNK